MGRNAPGGARVNLMNRGPLGLRAPKNASLKGSRMRMAARGENCTLRLTGVCNHDPATTVLAHIRMFGWAGMAQKPPDFLGVFACSCCHDALDRRNNGEAWGFDDLLRALGETLIRQHALGNYGPLK